MKRKKILIVLAAVLVLLVPLTVFAVSSNAPAAKTMRGFLGLDMSKLTDQQKTHLKDYFKKSDDLKKDTINQMVADGSITKEQGDAAIKRIDDASKNVDENGFPKGFDMRKGGFEGFGPFGMKGFDASKLTDQQKTDLKDYLKQTAVLQKENISKLVSFGSMTKEQGDNASKKIDDMIANLEQNDFSKGFGIGKGGFGFFGGFEPFGIRGLNASKLTDDQKAELKAIHDKMIDLQKQYINKMVANGLMTQEQADAAIKRIDGMANNFGQGGAPKGPEMRKGGFDGHGVKGRFTPNQGAKPAL